MPAGPDRLVITCEHAGNMVPERYRPLFSGHEHLLPTHRGWDPGALLLAREMSERFMRRCTSTRRPACSPT